MKTKLIYFSAISLFIIFCGYLVAESGLFSNISADCGRCILLQAESTTKKSPETAVEAAQTSAQTVSDTEKIIFTADNAPQETYYIGADDPCSEDPSLENSFKLQLELNTKGASISKAIFSNGNNNGFDDRDYKNPKPLELLTPLELYNGDPVYSMANTQLILEEHGQQLSLDKLNWQCYGVEAAPDGCEKATFIAEIKNASTGKAMLKLTKTFAIGRNTYSALCNISLENLSPVAHKVRFNMHGPVGLNREGVRADMRKVVGAFRNSEGGIVSKRIDVGKAKKDSSAENMRLIHDSDSFLWAAMTNKYFAAIVVPQAQPGENGEDWIQDKLVRYYQLKGGEKDAAIGFDVKTRSVLLAPAGLAQSTEDYSFELYLGPKDKTLFDNNDHYKNLGFYQTIDFLSCCCPKGIISPIAFFIMWLMNSIYAVIHNYGVAIILLVFIVRIILHPLTKMGQIRMNRFTKVASAPEVQEIKKKYAKSPMEMQKRISEFNRSKGVGPADMLFGMVPTFIQMPLWIALWTAVNSSINLRGAAFLPFWITDLSVPDALIRWKAFNLPLLGEISSLNLLPILMGGAFYFQQKMMPQQAAATPEAAQQQKMMKVMMLFMFPIMLYKAPSGVSLYIMSSVSAGAIEQYYIRKHIKEKEDMESRGLIDVTSKTGGKVKKKKPKPMYKKFT